MRFGILLVKRLSWGWMVLRPFNEGIDHSVGLDGCFLVLDSLLRGVPYQVGVAAH